MNIFNITDIFNIFAGSGIGGASYAPAFWLNNLGLSNKVATNTRTSTATAWDHEGVLVEGEAGEIMLDGGRREKNLATALTTHTISVDSGRDYQVSCEGDSGSTVVISGAFTGTLTNDGADRQAFGNAKNSTSTTLTLTVTGVLTHMQIQDVTGRSNDAPSEKLGLGATQWYSTTNGNTVSGGAVTEAPGVAISPIPQVLMQPQGTNSAPASWDLTDAIYDKVGTAVAALDAIGLTGAANTATTLIDDDGTAYELIQAVNSPFKTLIPNDSNPLCYRLFVGADSDETRFIGFDVNIKGGTKGRHFFTFNSKTGAQGINSTNGAWVSTEVRRVGDWWEILVEFQNDSSGNDEARVDIYPAYGTVITSGNAAATGSCVIGNFEIHLNKTTAEVRGTTPIFTTTAAVIRDADLIEVADWDGIANHTEGLLIFSIKLFTDLANTSGTYVRAGSVNNKLVDGSVGSGLEAYDGTNTASVTSGGLAGEEITAGVIWSATYNKFVVGYYDPTTAAFVWGTEKAFSSWASGAALKLEIGYDMDEPYTLRSLLMYKDVPPGTTTMTDVQDWIEANAETEISKREG